MSKKITDDQHYKFLQDFANDHSIVIGGDMKVTCSINHISIEALDREKGCKIEDSNFLHDQIRGAEAFLYWLRRNNYTIMKGKK